jgi:hypothetical protein
MENKTKAKAVATAPAKLKLTIEPDAFNAQLVPFVGENKVGWPGDEHKQFVEGFIGEMKDESGNAPVLSQEQWDRIWACIRPKEDVLQRVIGQAFNDAGYSLSAEVGDALALVVSPQQFADFLAKTVNPKTGKPFIKKEAKRGAKKKKFAALISTGAAAEEGD